MKDGTRKTRKTRKTRQNQEERVSPLSNAAGVRYSPVESVPLSLRRG